MSDGARLLLVGMGTTSESALRGLLAKFEVVALARRAEPGDAALELAGCSDVQIENDISISSIGALIERTRPDCVAVSSYHRILPAAMICGRPFVNVHYAPLPRYRGRATVNWAIINGESHTAITVHELLPALDAGGILFQQLVPIGPRDTVTDLYGRLNQIQERALPLAVSRLLDGDHGEPQDESRATYSCTRVPADGEIDWTRPALEIDRLIRALTAPFPGAFTWLGSDRVVVNRAEPVPGVYQGAVPGRVAAIDRALGTVDMLTGSGILRLQDITVNDRSMRPADAITSLGATLGFDRAMLIDLMGEMNRAAVARTREVVPS